MAEPDRVRVPGTVPRKPERWWQHLPRRVRNKWRFRHRRVGLRHILAATVAGIVLLGGLAWLAWDAKGQTTDPNDWYEIARTVVFAFAAIGAVPAGYIAYRRQQALEDQRDLDRRNYELDREKLDGEQQREELRQVELTVADRRADDAVHRARFIEAAAQLGSDKAAIRLAGVYALAQLADDWGHSGDSRAQQQCVDVLCAYIRMPFPGHYSRPPLGPGLDPSDKGKFVADLAEVQVRETLIRVASAHLQGANLGSWSGLTFDFTGARFPAPGRYDFTGANFTDSTVRFDRALLDGGTVSFDYALFERSTVTFHRAVVIGGGEIGFGRARMVSGELHFGGAAVQPKGRIDFDGFEIRGGRVSFDQVTVYDGVVIFERTRAPGGMIDCADIYTVGTGAFILSHVSFTGDGHMNLDGQRLEDNTVWGRTRVDGPPDLTFERPIQPTAEEIVEPPSLRMDDDSPVESAPRSDDS